MTESDSRPHGRTSSNGASSGAARGQPAHQGQREEERRQPRDRTPPLGRQAAVRDDEGDRDQRREQQRPAMRVVDRRRACSRQVASGAVGEAGVGRRRARPTPGSTSGRAAASRSRRRRCGARAASRPRTVASRPGWKTTSSTTPPAYQPLARSRAMSTGRTTRYRSAVVAASTHRALMAPMILATYRRDNSAATERAAGLADVVLHVLDVAEAGLLRADAAVGHPGQRPQHDADDQEPAGDLVLLLLLRRSAPTARRGRSR